MATPLNSLETSAILAVNVEMHSGASVYTVNVAAAEHFPNDVGPNTTNFCLLAEDIGERPAGLYYWNGLKWFYALTALDISQVFTTDYTVKVIFNSSTAYTPAANSKIYRNSVVQPSNSTVAANDLTIWAILEPGSSGGGTEVTSVNGKTGTVTLVAADVGAVSSVAMTVPAALLAVTGSPITSTGTLAVTLATQAASVVLAGPTTGTAAPTFRALVAADVPVLDAAKVTTGVLGTARLGTGTASATGYLNGAGAWKQVAYTEISGTPTIPAAQIQSDWTQATTTAADFIKNKPTLTTGTVTSVAVTAPAALLTVAGGPVTASGTIALTLPTQTANAVFAGPTTGAATAPTFRALVATDIPALDAAKVTTGTFGVARVGTGSGTATTYLNGSGAFTALNAPTASVRGGALQQAQTALPDLAAAPDETWVNTVLKPFLVAAGLLAAA